MKTRHVLGMLLVLCAVGFVGCSDDDDNKEPEGSLTLNMMNEDNGKTLLGTSDVYINKSHNFRASSSFITDMGETGGLGASPQVRLDNISQEVAVISNHLYYIYDRKALVDFPSGKRAMEIGSGYYKAYVVAPIVKADATTGAVVKYVLAYPETNNLPEYEQIIGNMKYVGESVEYNLPKDAELVFSDYLEDEKDAFDIRLTDGRLKVTLLRDIDKYSGPYGNYGMYVRSGSTFSYLIFQAGMDR